MQQILFIDIFTLLFKSALHNSGDKLAHFLEHFLTAYTAFGTMHRCCCRTVILSPVGSNIVPITVYTVKKCSRRWASLSAETCRTDLKKINRNINRRILLYLVGCLHKCSNNAGTHERQVYK